MVRSLRHKLKPGSVPAVIFVVALALVPLSGTGSSGAATVGRPSFSTVPALAPAFGWNRSDYAIRCDGAPVEVQVRAESGWRASVAGRPFRAGGFTVNHRLKPGGAFTLAFRNGAQDTRRYHVRCLPSDFPPYRASTYGPGAPRLTLVQMKNRYATAFDRNGAPVWWSKTDGSPVDVKFFPDGTFAYAPVSGISFRHFKVRSLEGRLIRIVDGGNGLGADSHDLQLLPNGNYLLGAHRRISGVDATRFGGVANATIDTAQIQEQTPSGKVVWKWNAWPGIGLAETGRWWKTIVSWGQPYDVHHWNSVDRRGRQILLSFRHLDAVYCIDRRSGRILWKVGGTKTPERLRVRQDSRSRYPLGGQHDARFGPGTSFTVLDNATNLEPKQPRAVRYRVDRKKRQVLLVRQITDDRVGVSVGFGSAHLSANGNWTIGWGAVGKDGVNGTYRPDGTPVFRLVTPGSLSYRANPVTSGKPTIERLRLAMNRVAARQSG